jgi:hypothetical protein
MVSKQIPVHDGRLFAWEGNVGACDRSDLGPKGMCDRIYDDACDVGFYVRSHKTGKYVLFVLHHQEPTKDSEVGAWHFSSQCAKFNIVVFND